MSWLPSILCLLVARVCADNLITYRIPITNEQKKALGYPEGTYLNFTELTTKNGYVSEQHAVTTEDGYILTVFRLKSPNCTQLQPHPVIMVHGIVLNSDEFLNPGVEAGWPYLLADACHDVWLGNQRGNVYGRAHTTLDPDKDAAFWDFSLDEFGLYDTPATIDYVLQNTQSEKVNLIGYSLGGQSILITLSGRPEYNSKVDVNVVLASSSTFRNVRNVLVRLVAYLAYLLEKPLRSIGIQEVFSKNSLLHVILEFVCQHASLYNECYFLVGFFDSPNPGSLSVGAMQTLFSSFASGTSIKLVSQLGNNVIKDGLYKYDYGAEGNLARYGNATAPAYNISAVVAPTLVIHGLSDGFVVTQDVNRLVSQLPNLLELFIVADPLWNHVDCGWSKNIPTAVYPKVAEYFSNSSSSVKLPALPAIPVPALPTASSLLQTLLP